MAQENIALVDVHVGYLPPSRWDELEGVSPRARLTLGGHEIRPGLTEEPVPWQSLGVIPHWVGDDSETCVAAIEPHNYRNRGADEWRGFLAAARQRREIALVISMIGHPRDSTVVRITGTSDSVALPGAGFAFASVVGDRTTLMTPPAICDGLERADHNLALRLLDLMTPNQGWWSLHLGDVEISSDPDSDATIGPPGGTLVPLLISSHDEVVAAVWISPNRCVRHYIVPWLPAWTPMIAWLRQEAIPQFVPTASRRGSAGAARA